MNPGQLIEQFQQLKPLRQRLDDVWRQCYEYTFPLRADGLGSTVDAQQGLSNKARVLDDTASDSVKVLAANIMSGMTPNHVRWPDMTANDENDVERRWLYDASNTIWKAIHAANFDSAAYECAIDAVIAGWFGLYVDEDIETGGYRFEQWPIATLYCAASKPGGKIDIVYREMQLTAIQLVNEYGEDNVSPQALALSKNEPHSMLRVIWAIHPRKMYVTGSKMAKNLPFASCHIELDTKKLLREGGYNEMPVIIPRLMSIPNSVYGVGPVYDVLPTIRELNYLKYLYRSQGEIEIAPPLIAKSDGVLNPRTVKLGAKKIIVAADVDSIKMLPTAGNWQLAESMIDRLTASIRKHLMADILQPQDGPMMTATEVHARMGIIRQLLGPVYGRYHAEYLQPLVERCFGIALRAGWLGQPPDSLISKTLTIKYLSPMSRAQMAEEVTAIQNYAATVANIAQIKPEALDSFDVDSALAHIGKGLGVPNDVIPTGEELAQLREDKDAAQQQIESQQSAQTVQQMGMDAAMQRYAKGAS